jgi:hypothetical protein
VFCPRCGAEYRPGFTQCADCHVPLVDRLPGEGVPVKTAGGSGSPEAHRAGGRDSARREPRPDVELVRVFATGDPGLVALAKSLLQSASIEFMVRGEGIQNLFGIGSLSLVNPFTGLVEFLVAAEDADDARRLLEDPATSDDVDEDGAADR